MKVEQEINISNDGQDVNVKQKVENGNTLSSQQSNITQTVTPAQSYEEKIWDLEKQLHEQYAINNNAKAGHIISLIAAIISVVGGYGYIYSHSTSEFVGEKLSYCIANNSYTVDVLLMAAIACFFVIAALFLIAYNTGCQRRTDQFVTFAIRCRYYTGNKEQFKKIYRRGYCPFNKKSWDIPQDIFKLICQILLALFVIIFFVTAVHVCVYVNSDIRLISRIWIVVFGGSALLSISLFYCWYKTYNDKYKKWEIEYSKMITCPYSDEKTCKNCINIKI